jgi:hypothetical protein
VDPEVAHGSFWTLVSPDTRCSPQCWAPEPVSWSLVFVTMAQLTFKNPGPHRQPLSGLSVRAGLLAVDWAKQSGCPCDSLNVRAVPPQHAGPFTFSSAVTVTSRIQLPDFLA